MVSDFWSKASPPPKTLCLLDGTYTGSDSMIDPPQGLHGTSAAPITIKALNDGKVLIDGQSARTPIELVASDWFVIEGINARNGVNDRDLSGSVVRILSNNAIVRRVVVWDAGDTNAPIVDLGGDNILLEDVAAFGLGRKVVESSFGGDFNTCRRCWARWEGSHFIGPKHTYTLTYNNYNMTIENSIGTWSGEKMKQSYTLMCTSGNSSPDCGTIFNNFAVEQPGGIFTLDRIDTGSPDANSKILGSIAYITGGDRFAPDALIALGTVGALELSNSVAYVQPGTYSATHTIQLNNGSGNNRVARGLSSVGGSGMAIFGGWQILGRIEFGSTTSVVGNIYTGTTGANVCKRYKDGVLTNEPLWPWPMDQRIYDAMIQAGRTPFYVTQLIEAMFGPIPNECRSANSPAQVRQDPPRPQNVRTAGQ